MPALRLRKEARAVIVSLFAQMLAVRNDDSTHAGEDDRVTGDEMQARQRFRAWRQCGDYLRTMRDSFETDAYRDQLEIDVMPSGDRVEYDHLAFLEGLYEHTRRGNTDVAGDVIYEWFDSLLCDGRFEECDDLLQRSMPEYLDVNGMLSMLTITAAARDKLTRRQGFYHRVENRLRELTGEDYAKQLLAGLQ